MRMKHRGLYRSDSDWWQALAQEFAQLQCHALFRLTRCLDLGEQIECQLTAKDLALNTLEVQQFNGLLLEFIDAGGTPFRRGTQRRNRNRLQPELGLNPGKDAAERYRSRMRIDVVAQPLKGAGLRHRLRK